MLFVVRFSTTSDAISWLIRKRTDFSISHVEFELVQDWEGHPAGSTLGSRWPDGVRWRLPSANAKQRDVVRLVRPGTDDAATWVARNRIGWGYNLLGTAGIGLGVQDWHDRDKRFCSEAVTEGYEQTSWPLFDRNVMCSLITPRDVRIITGWGSV